MSEKYTISLNTPPLIIKSNSVILYKTINGDDICVTQNNIHPSHIINKQYKLGEKSVHFNNDILINHQETDELVISDSESFNLVNYPTMLNHIDIVYNNHDEDIYQIFHLYLVNDVIKCDGLEKTNTLSYDLVLNRFVGICVYNEINQANQMYIVYSRKMKHQKLIKLKNTQPYHLTNSIDELAYYPIIVICCQSQHTLEDFIQLYPYLVKNIFNYQL
jgi:hypothetical protein